MASTSLERQVGDLLSAARVPGLAVAIVHNGKLDHVVSLGLRDVRSRAPIDTHTVFEAASLSKPVFAYAILKMVDAGMLSLDEPLPVGDLMVPDPRMSQITVRHILSHRSGLPNWQSESRPLRTYFKPGARFSYSGEGFALLQKVVEGRTDEALEAVMDRLVFGPLGMLESSYVWRESFESNHAAPHDEGLGLRPKFKPTSANAAFSLHTTTEDYGRFLEAVMSGDGLAPATASTGLNRPSTRRSMASCPWTASRDSSLLTWHGGSGGDLNRAVPPFSTGAPTIMRGPMLSGVLSMGAHSLPL